MKDTKTPETQKEQHFATLDISEKTKKALEKMMLVEMTEIQQKTIPKALEGRDLLVAAKTGSGKTLAFAIPLIENLRKQRWSEQDGVGAVVLLPTKELAWQIYEVFKSVCTEHELVIGITVGGQQPEVERCYLHTISILIATPKRLLCHMETSPTLNLDNLKSLVLDEADMLLDQKQRKVIDMIVEGLPGKKQIMLFSATQKAVISGLGKLRLENPEYIGVVSVLERLPLSLDQTYVFCELADRIPFIGALLKKNRWNKIIVFVSSQKQVRFYYKLFKHLPNRVFVFQLHGNMSLEKQTVSCQEFSQKGPSILFTTNIAARGMDFSLVDIICQLDPPENLDEYIHRVGRAGRFDRKGRSILLLEKSERGLLETLEKEGIPLKEKQLQNYMRLIHTASFRKLVLRFLEKIPDLARLATSAITALRKNTFQKTGKKETPQLEAFEKYLDFRHSEEETNIEN